MGTVICPSSGGRPPLPGRAASFPWKIRFRGLTEFLWVRQQKSCKAVPTRAAAIDAVLRPPTSSTARASLTDDKILVVFDTRAPFACQ